jgi:hypothetical protein
MISVLTSSVKGKFRIVEGKQDEGGLVGFC